MNYNKDLLIMTHAGYEVWLDLKQCYFFSELPGCLIIQYELAKQKQSIDNLVTTLLIKDALNPF